MQWLKRTVMTLVGIVALWALVGLMLPSEFKIERSTDITAPPGKVYVLIADPRSWKRWTIWNQRDPAMQVDYGGTPTGKGASWSWKSKSEGNGSMVFTDAVPDRRVDYRLSFPDFGMESQGALRIEPAGSGVRVSWSNEGKLGMNPMQRWFGLFMDRMVGPDFEGGLANLKRIAEEK